MLLEPLLKLAASNDIKIVLLMNKIDLFKQKVAEVSVAEHWPDYQGPEYDYGAALQFFIQKFLDLDGAEDLVIHICCTDATDAESFKIPMRSIESALLEDCAPTTRPGDKARPERQFRTNLGHGVRQYLSLRTAEGVYKARVREMR